MGPWSFIAARFDRLLNTKLRYVGRKELGTSAVGISVIHKKEASEIVASTFE